MLANPGKEIYDVIRYFGSRKKIFNVHFRNIRGHRDDFMEVAVDEGDVDMFKALQTYVEADLRYPGVMAECTRYAAARVLNRFGDHGNQGAHPVRQTGDRQRNSGKLRRKFMSGPSLRRIPGRPPQNG